MNTTKKSITALSISAFLLAASTLVVAGDYTEKQNKSINEQDSKSENMGFQGSGQQSQQGQQGSGSMNGQGGGSSSMDSGHGSGSTGSSGSSGGSNSSSGGGY